MTHDHGLYYLQFILHSDQNILSHFMIQLNSPLPANIVQVLVEMRPGGEATLTVRSKVLMTDSIESSRLQQTS